MTKQKIREALNKFDHQTLDECTEYYDLVNLYEAATFNKPLDSQETKAMNDAIKTKNPATISATLQGIAAQRATKTNPSLAKQMQVPQAEVKEGLDEDDLNDIYAEECDLEEGRHDLKVEPTKAIESGKTHYRLRDQKTGELASFKIPYWYQTKEGAQEAIQDETRDLGYGKKTESLKLDEDMYEDCEGGPFIVQVYDDFKAGKLRVLGDDGVHGTHQVAFPTKLRTGNGDMYKVGRMSWNGKNYRANTHDVLSKVTGAAKVGPVNPISSAAKEEPQPEEIPQEKPVQQRSRGGNFKGRKLQREEFEDSESQILNEVDLTTGEGDLEHSVYIDFNGIKVDPKELSDEIYAVMFKTPTKANGDLKNAAMVLVKLYEHCIVNGEEFVPRVDLLAESGVPVPERAGSGSTWFNNFGQLDLAHLNDSKVYPGSNLQDWIEGRCPYQYIDATTGKPVGHYKRDGSWEEHPTSGNPYGQDLRSYVGQAFNQREDQGIQSDRSHGFGDTKMSSGGSTVIRTPHKKEIPAEAPKARTRGGNFKGRKLQRESMDLYKPEWSDLENEESKKMRNIYRKEYYLDEEAEITAPPYDDYRNDRKFSGICLKHNWPIDYARKYLFGEEID